MSAPAIKSSMPGVGTPNASTGHTMLPMNMVSQKVVPTSDQTSGGIKPLQNPTNHNFVTMQTPAQQLSQPLSLIQEHRAPYFGNNIPTDQLQQQQQPLQHQQQQQPQQQVPPQPQQQQQAQDPSKMMQNGMEQSKVILHFDFIKKNFS